MNIFESIKNKFGNVIVEVEGFFTERFINICKFKGVKINEIRNIKSGIIRFSVSIKDFKKLKNIANKTKCKIKIKKKRGLYFWAFRYRKRKYFLGGIIAVVFMFILSNSIIWKVNINLDISQNEYDNILNRINESGIHVGKINIGIDNNDIIKSLRAEFTEYAWIGFDIRGSQAYIEFKEKVVLEDKDVQETRIGDIYANKSGIITKIIPENGTALYKEGSYIEEGMMVIEGKLNTQFYGSIDISARGILKIKSEYIFEKEYFYTGSLKEYTGEEKYNIGFSVNLNEYYFNYLNNSEKYDKIKYNKDFNFFNLTLSFDFYKFERFEYNEITYTKEQLVEMMESESKNYIENVMDSVDNPSLLSESKYIENTYSGFKVKIIYYVEEEIGEFKPR